jgi:[protein-PII] uridylyltransferase
VFSDTGRNLELNPSEEARLRVRLEQAAVGKLNVKHLLANRPKAIPPSRGARLSPTATFDNDASPSATLIEIVAQDRAGLLYDLARTLSSNGCHIELVLIETEAHKAVDVFYITFQGAKLSAELGGQLMTQLQDVCAG